MAERVPEFKPLGLKRRLQKTIEMIRLDVEDDDEEGISLQDLDRFDCGRYSADIRSRAESIANSKPPEETFGLDNDISKTVANKIGEEFNFDCIKEKWNGNDTTLEIPPLEYYKSIHQEIIMPRKSSSAVSTPKQAIKEEPEEGSDVGSDVEEVETPSRRRSTRMPKPVVRKSLKDASDSEEDDDDSDEGGKGKKGAKRAPAKKATPAKGKAASNGTKRPLSNGTPQSKAKKARKDESEEDEEEDDEEEASGDDKDEDYDTMEDDEEEAAEKSKGKAKPARAPAKPKGKKGDEDEEDDEEEDAEWEEGSDVGSDVEEVETPSRRCSTRMPKPVVRKSLKDASDSEEDDDDSDEGGKGKKGAKRAPAKKATPAKGKAASNGTKRPLSNGTPQSKAKKARKDESEEDEEEDDEYIAEIGQASAKKFLTMKSSPGTSGGGGSGRVGRPSKKRARISLPTGSSDKEEDASHSKSNSLYQMKSAGNTDCMKCTVCIEYPRKEVYLCANGHSVCGRCIAGVTRCSVCSVNYGRKNTRNLALETLLDSMKFNCGFWKDGCLGRNISRNRMNAHDIQCDHNPNTTAIKFCDSFNSSCYGFTPGACQFRVCPKAIVEDDQHKEDVIEHLTSSLHNVPLQKTEMGQKNFVQFSISTDLNEQVFTPAGLFELCDSTGATIGHYLLIWQVSKPGQDHFFSWNVVEVSAAPENPDGKSTRSQVTVNFLMKAQVDPDMVAKYGEGCAPDLNWTIKAALLTEWKDFIMAPAEERMPFSVLLPESFLKQHYQGQDEMCKLFLSFSSGGNDE